MELVTHHITWPSRRNHKPLMIAPIGDIQWSGKRGVTAGDTLKRHIDKCMKLDALFLGTGDYTDFMSPSNRQRFKAAALYDSAKDVVDDAALELVHELYEDYLKPTKGRWLGLCHGHHWAQLRTGDTTDMRLCQMLDAKFLGTCAYIRIVFHSHGSRFSLVLFVHHGCGGGMKMSAPLNKIENLLPYWDADVFLLGHMSKQVAAPVNRITPRWHGFGSPDLVHRKVYMVGCGSFARGYVEWAKQGRIPMGSYVEQRLLNPVSLGAPLIKIVPRVKYRRYGSRKAGKDRAVWEPDVTVEL